MLTRITPTILVLLAAAAPALAQEAPPADAVPMSKYLRISVKEGRLVGEVVPPDPVDPAAAANPPAAGFGGAATARETVRILNVDGDVSILRRATTISVSASNAKGSRSISISPTAVSLTRTADDPAGGQLRITFQQRSPTARGGGAGAANAVTLTVTRVGVGATGTPVRLTEATFADMWSLHPQEMRQYVEPFFREMGLPSIFEVTLEEARPLFAALDVAPQNLAAAKAKVDALLKQLSSDSWPQREAARADLLALGPAAVPILRDLPIDDLPVEAATAVKAALAAVIDGRLSDPDFLLRCVAIDDSAIATRAAREYEKVAGKKLAIDLALPAPERAKQIDKLRLAAPE